MLVFDFGNSSEDTSYELGETNRLWRGEKKEVDLPRFSFASASASTNNFSIENKLGEGGFGSVYKVRLQPLTIMFYNPSWSVKAHLIYTKFLLLGVIVVT